MTLNTAQYLAPLNSQQVLSGYAQGVKEGPGLTIQPNGAITLDPTTAITLGFLISSTLPAPVLSWPSAPPADDAILRSDSSGNLNWSVNYVPTVPLGGTFPQTGAAVLPVGPTSSQPASAQRGYIRYNSDLESLEWYNGISWLLASPPSGGVFSFVSTITPTAVNVGDLWFDENFQQEKVWDGATWVATTPIATTTSLGRLQVGANLQVTPAGVVSVASTTGFSGGISNLGVTTIVDNTGSASVSEALSANQGRLLQQQLSALLAAANITFAGTINSSGVLLTVTTTSSAVGFSIGSPLPSPAANNVDFFVLCTAAGTFTPAGTPVVTVTQGDWLLSDGTVWQFLNVGYDPPIASTTQAGLVELATDAEVQAGTDATRAVTPSGLNSRVSTTTQTGLIELATVAEVQTGSDNTRAVTPLGLDNRVASETLSGIAEIATQAEVDTGTDDARFVTPLKLATYISSGQINATEVPLSPAINGNTTVQAALNDAVYNIASANTSVTITETATGQVDLSVTQATETQIGGAEVATQTETNTGSDDTRFVTPLKLNNRVASETLSGIAEIATQAETDGGVDDTRIVTPLKLATRTATETLTGIAEIATQAETDAGTDDTRIVTPLKLATRTATETLTGIAEIATQVETETGTDDTRIVSPLKLRTATVYKSDFNAKGDILSADANDSPLILSVGVDGQVLRADSAAASGLAWYTIPAVVPPTIKNIDNISGSFNGTTTAFSLAIGGVAYIPSPSTNIVVYLGGVPQIPGAGNAYTVTGSTITFTEAPATDTTFYAFTVA